MESKIEVSESNVTFETIYKSIMRQRMKNFGRRTV